jgi:hypothetical protein
MLPMHAPPGYIPPLHAQALGRLGSAPEMLGSAADGSAGGRAVGRDERTLVLMDEPESHLHPPLLASLIRAV